MTARLGTSRPDRANGHQPGRLETIRRPAWRDQLGARAPRVIAGVLAGAMIVAGVRATLAGQPELPPPPAPPPRSDQAAESFAEGFARKFMSWDPNRPEVHERAVSRFLSDELDASGGLDPDAPQQVLWTAAVGAERRNGRQLVTVAVDTDRGDYHLAVPVERDQRGLLAVVAYPALVGPPPVSLDRQLADEDEVTDHQLRTVAERAVRNYLAGEKQDLLADLDPAAVVSLPDRRLEVRLVDEITQAAPNRVAVQVQAQGDRVTWTLRYELAVVRRERWYVRAIAVDPRATTRRSR